MNVRYRICTALFVCVSLPALAQQFAQMAAVSEPLALSPSPVPIVPTRGITLDVVVTGKSKLPVAGLQQQNFTILDNKQPQKITSFQPIQLSSMKADSPVEIILLIDSLNTSFDNVSYERKQMDQFFLQNGGHLATPVSMIFLSDLGAQTLQGSTRDGNLLVKAMDQKETAVRMLHRSGGFFAAEELVQYSLNALSAIAGYESKRPGRKMLIWISPGWPLIADPNIDLTSKEKQQVFDSIVSTSNQLRQARITLYNIDPLGMEDAGRIRTVYYREYLKGIADPAQAMPPNLSLQVIASQSGGRVLNSSNGIAEEIASCAQDANAFYTLSFNPTPVAHPNQYRRLEVKIDQPGLIARTRTGYYGQP